MVNTRSSYVFDVSGYVLRENILHSRSRVLSRHGRLLIGFARLRLQLTHNAGPYFRLIDSLYPFGQDQNNGLTGTGVHPFRSSICIKYSWCALIGDAPPLGHVEVKVHTCAAQHT